MRKSDFLSDNFEKVHGQIVCSDELFNNTYISSNEVETYHREKLSRVIAEKIKDYVKVEKKVSPVTGNNETIYYLDVFLMKDK